MGVGPYSVSGVKTTWSRLWLVQECVCVCMCDIVLERFRGFFFLEHACLVPNISVDGFGGVWGLSYGISN